jgi:hypothetical protein
MARSFLHIAEASSDPEIARMATSVLEDLNGERAIEALLEDAATRWHRPRTNTVFAVCVLVAGLLAGSGLAAAVAADGATPWWYAVLAGVAYIGLGWLVARKRLAPPPGARCRSSQTVGAGLSAVGVGLGALGLLAAAGHSALLSVFAWTYLWVAALHTALHPSAEGALEPVMRYFVLPAAGLAVVLAFIVASDPERSSVGIGVRLYVGQEERIRQLGGYRKHAASLAALGVASAGFALVVRAAFPSMPL